MFFLLVYSYYSKKKLIWLYKLFICIFTLPFSACVLGVVKKSHRRCQNIVVLAAYEFLPQKRAQCKREHGPCRAEHVNAVLLVVARLVALEHRFDRRWVFRAVGSPEFCSPESFQIEFPAKLL